MRYWKVGGVVCVGLISVIVGSATIVRAAPPKTLLESYYRCYRDLAIHLSKKNALSVSDQDVMFPSHDAQKRGYFVLTPENVYFIPMGALLERRHQIQFKLENGKTEISFFDPESESYPLIRLSRPKPSMNVQAVEAKKEDRDDSANLSVIQKDLYQRVGSIYEIAKGDLERYFEEKKKLDENEIKYRNRKLIALLQDLATQDWDRLQNATKDVDLLVSDTEQFLKMYPELQPQGEVIKRYVSNNGWLPPVPYREHYVDGSLQTCIKSDDPELKRLAELEVKKIDAIAKLPINDSLRRMYSVDRDLTDQEIEKIAEEQTNSQLGPLKHRPVYPSEPFKPLKLNAEEIVQSAEEKAANDSKDSKIASGTPTPGKREPLGLFHTLYSANFRTNGSLNPEENPLWREPYSLDEESRKFLAQEIQGRFKDANKKLKLNELLEVRKVKFPLREKGYIEFLAEWRYPSFDLWALREGRPPYYAEGDFDCDGKKDKAVILAKDSKAHRGSIHIFLSDGRTIDTGVDADSLEVTRKGTLLGFRKSECEVIEAELFEKSSLSLAYNRKEKRFEEFRTPEPWSSEAPRSPLVTKDTCPGEGCTFGEWTAKEAVKLFERPGSSKVVMTVKKGAKVRAITGEMHFKDPLRVRVIRDKAPYKAGKDLYVLSYAGEGGFDVWYEGRVLLDFEILDLVGKSHGHGPYFDCVWPKARKNPDCWIAIRDRTPPSKGTWWIKIKANGKQGWAKEADSFRGVFPRYEN